MSADIAKLRKKRYLFIVAFILFLTPAMSCLLISLTCKKSVKRSIPGLSLTSVEEPDNTRSVDAIYHCQIDGWMS